MELLLNQISCPIALISIVVAVQRHHRRRRTDSSTSCASPSAAAAATARPPVTTPLPGGDDGATAATAALQQVVVSGSASLAVAPSSTSVARARAPGSSNASNVRDFSVPLLVAQLTMHVFSGLTALLTTAMAFYKPSVDPSLPEDTIQNETNCEVLGGFASTAYVLAKAG